MILVTGWTGNTGRLVVEKIRARFPDQPLIGVARSFGVAPAGVIAATADLAREPEVAAIFDRYPLRRVVHVANIRYSPLLLRLAEAHRVEHVVLVHTAAIHSRHQEHRALYAEIEEAILRSRHAHTVWTILRPTMIYGNRRDHNLHRLIRALARAPVFPVFGDGSARMQPVHVEDLATAIVACLDNPKTAYRAYDLSGGSVVTYREMLGMIAAELGRHVVFVPVPHPLALGLAVLYARLAKSPRITVEQIRRLREDKSCPHTAAQADLGFCPRPFAEGLHQEIAELRRDGII